MFASTEKVVVVPPTRPNPGGPTRRDLEDLASLLTRELYELEVELGAPVVIGTTRHRNWTMFVIGPRPANPVLDGMRPKEVSLPTLTLDRSRQTLMADAPGLEGVMEALSGLRTMTSSGVDHLELTDGVSRDEMIERVIVGYIDDVEQPRCRTHGSPDAVPGSLSGRLIGALRLPGSPSPGRCRLASRRQQPTRTEDRPSPGHRSAGR